MSRAVREAGFTVALVGTGGDELFGGYTSFRDLPALHAWSRRLGWMPRAAMVEGAQLAIGALQPDRGAMPRQTRWAKLPEMVRRGDDLLALYQLAYALFLPDFQSQLLAPASAGALTDGLPRETRARLERELRDRSDLQAISVLEQRLFLGERLLRDNDAASMAASIEQRLPLVDQVLLETVGGLPDAVRYQPVLRKAALRRAGLRGLDPALFERPKRGFVLPFDRWIRQGLSGSIDQTLCDPEAGARRRARAGGGRTTLARLSRRSPRSLLVSGLGPLRAGALVSPARGPHMNRFGGPRPEGRPAASSERAAVLPALIRLALLGLAAAAALFAFGWVHPGWGESAAPMAGYSCPMHPEVRAGIPGDCPLCGMALVPLAPERPLRGTAVPLPTLPPAASDLVRRRVLSEERWVPAWARTEKVLRARVYDEDLGTLPAGTRAVFHPALRPATAIPVQRVEGAAHSWDGSTSDIDFQLDSHAAVLTAGMVGWLELPRLPREALIIPSSGVLQSPDGPYVLVLQPDGSDTFTRRPIQVGRTSSGQAVVGAGLSQDERVMVRNAFFLDAERRLGATGGSTGR